MDAALLVLLAANPGISQSQVGRRLDIQRANMVAFIARHEQRGLLVRRALDGRTQALALSPAGRALLARARRIMAAHEKALLARVPEELRPSVMPLLHALWDPATPRKR